MTNLRPDARTPATVAPSRRRRRGDDAHATIVDVAARAGVSTATASRALNAPARVSPELRARVVASAAALAYVPDPAARRLASRRSGLIGIVTGDLRDGGTAACVGALQPRLAAAGFATLLAVTDGHGAGVREAMAGLVAQGVEAVVLIDCADGGATSTAPPGRMLPVVRAGGSADGPTPGDVVVDATVAGATIARYLLDLGHATFGWVAAAGDRAWWAAGLRDGLTAALVAAGGRPPIALAVGPGGAAVAVRAELGGGQTLPSALICADTQLAAAVLRALAGRGIAVPLHVSVVGCGDPPWARQLDPPLTTLRIPADRLGEAAAEQVLARLRGEAPGRRALVAKLVVRGSTGPAATRD